MPGVLGWCRAGHRFEASGKAGMRMLADFPRGIPTPAPFGPRDEDADPIRGVPVTAGLLLASQRAAFLMNSFASSGAGFAPPK